MFEVFVSCNERDHYPAMVDPTEHKDGFVRPMFDLATVRRIAADSQTEAAKVGHGSVDTIHVLAGDVDGAEHTVVLNICWMYLGGERHEEAVELVEADENGRYDIGGYGWNWYVLDEHQNPMIPPQVERFPLPPFPGLPGQRTA